jgi:hypothetical protein
LGVRLALLVDLPDGIDITEPSDIVIMSPSVAELTVFVNVEADWAAAGSFAHAMVTGDRDGVAIGTMLGAEVMLERWAKATGAAAASADATRVQERIV